MGLENMSDFRALCFTKTMLNVICTNRFVYYINRYLNKIFEAKNCYNNSAIK